MRRVKEHEPVQMFKFIDGLVISVPDGIVDYFGLSARMLWFAGCKRTKKKVVLTFVSPLSPRTPLTPPPLTSTIRREFKRKKYKKQKQPFTLIKEMEALRKKQVKKKKKGFKPDWFG